MAKHVTLHTLKYYWQATWHSKILTTSILVLAPLNAVISNLIVPYITAQIIGILSTGANDIQRYIPLLTILIVAYLVRLATTRCVDWLNWKLDANAGSYLLQQAFDKITSESFNFHNKNFSGTLTSNAAKFYNAYLDLEYTCVWEVVPLITTVVFAICAIAAISPLFALIIATSVTIFFITAFYTFRRTLTTESHLPKVESDGIGQLSDVITNISTVKSFAREDYESRHFNRATRRIAKETITCGRCSFQRNLILHIIVDSLRVGLILLIVFGQSYFGFTVANIVLILNLTTNVTNRIWRTTRILRSATRSLHNAAAMTSILDQEVEIRDQATTKLDLKKAEIDFHNIDFRYGKKNDQLFQNFSLQIKEGERVGLVGLSGSGKTTIAELLLRFIEPQKGNILIDGQDIARVTQNSLRENIAFVQQEPLLFHRTIEENIAYGKPNATHEEIVKAAKLSGADEFISRLPRGYRTEVGERGTMLSGGQRQRIAIARAILKDAPILILDEATSALDSESEALIQKSISNLLKGRTSIVIAHRLSTIADLDRIVVLKDGKIVEEGTHHQLLLKNGAYKKFWSRQSGAFIDTSDKNAPVGEEPELL